MYAFWETARPHVQGRKPMFVKSQETIIFEIVHCNTANRGYSGLSEEEDKILCYKQAAIYKRSSTTASIMVNDGAVAAAN